MSKKDDSGATFMMIVVLALAAGSVGGGGPQASGFAAKAGHLWDHMMSVLISICTLAAIVGGVGFIVYRLLVAGQDQPSEPQKMQSQKANVEVHVPSEFEKRELERQSLRYKQSVLTSKEIEAQLCEAKFLTDQKD